MRQKATSGSHRVPKYRPWNDLGLYVQNVRCMYLARGNRSLQEPLKYFSPFSMRDKVSEVPSRYVIPGEVQRRCNMGRGTTTSHLELLEKSGPPSLSPSSSLRSPVPPFRSNTPTNLATTRAIEPLAAPKIRAPDRTIDSNRPRADETVHSTGYHCSCMFRLRSPQGPSSLDSISARRLGGAATGPLHWFLPNHNHQPPWEPTAS